MANDNPLLTLRELGQSVWYDYIRSDLMSSGELERLILEDGLGGLTSNPAIFDKAITASSLYDERIRQLHQRDSQIGTADLFYALAIEDLRAAADLFADTHARSAGRDGFVSLEVSPDLAYDPRNTIYQALELEARVGRANLMIKVPGTLPGLEAIEELTAQGIKVNVTLLFGLERYEAVLEAYLRGLETRLDRGEEIAHLASVASFFVSRVDSAVDAVLSAEMERGRPVQHLLGTVAIANARLAHAHFLAVTASPRWQRLAAAGAQVQRLLWASTGTKNPAYSDVMYVESLIGPDTVNTLPPATYQAFRNHGKATLSLANKEAEARAVMEALPGLGIDLASITERLEREGVQNFVDAFDHLLQSLDEKRKQLTHH